MFITSAQCRQGRALFAMTQQELANASGVALRTIVSFEGTAAERIPIAANLSALRRALEALGAVFTQTGVLWQSPFSETQTRFISSLQLARGEHIRTAAEIAAEAPCPPDEVLRLVQLQILVSADSRPLLTAIGLNVARQLRDYELARQRPDANPVSRRLDVIARESDPDIRTKLAASLLTDWPHGLSDVEKKYLAGLIEHA